MTEKRYEYWKNSDTFYDTEIKYGQYFRILDKKEVVELLNALHEENEQLKQSMDNLFDYFAKWFEEERGIYAEDFCILWENIQKGDVE